MKIHYVNLIIMVLFMNSILCDSQEESLCMGTSESASDCSFLLTEEEESKGLYCCYFTGTNDDRIDYKSCLLLSSEECNQIDNKKSEYENKGYTNVDIDCKSFYHKLKYFLIFVIIVLNI